MNSILSPIGAIRSLSPILAVAFLGMYARRQLLCDREFVLISLHLFLSDSAMALGVRQVNLELVEELVPTCTLSAELDQEYEQR